MKNGKLEREVLDSKSKYDQVQISCGDVMLSVVYRASATYRGVALSTSHGCGCGSDSGRGV